MALTKPLSTQADQFRLGADYSSHASVVGKPNNHFIPKGMCPVNTRLGLVSNGASRQDSGALDHADVAFGDAFEQFLGGLVSPAVECGDRLFKAVELNDHRSLV